MAPRKIALLTDSCADLSPRIAEENRIHVVPLRIRCNDGEYRDGVDIRSADIYARLKRGSCPRPPRPRGRTSPPPSTASPGWATTGSSP